MNILLQSKDRFDQIGEVDLETRVLRKQNKSAYPDFSLSDISGSFAEADDHLLALYRIDGQLVLRVDEKEFPIDTATQVIRKRGFNDVSMMVRKGGEAATVFVGRAQVASTRDYMDTTPFVDAEEEDYCLFVHNVLNDPQRRQDIYRK